MVKWALGLPEYKLSFKVLCVYSEPLFKARIEWDSEIFAGQEASKLQQKNKGDG